MVEISTVQALPDPPRRQAIGNVARLPGPAGTLIVIAAVHGDISSREPGPPWPLKQTEVEAFAADGLVPVRVTVVADPQRPATDRWRAGFRPL